MICEKYTQHELGEISDEDYQVHLKGCTLCQEINRQDDFILEQVKALKRPVPAPQLWARISGDLSSEKTRGQKIPALKSKIFSYPLLKLAASFLIPILLVGFYFIFLKPGKPSGLLTDKALGKVEKMELAYMEAIAELEKVVEPGMNSLNIELALSYRDRLETIDEQIKLCKEELKDNPANTHIRRYLLAALQDKKQTLVELDALQSRGVGQ